MSKWVQFSFNCFWTPCVEKKTTEWQLLIQNANLWHGTVKMACHSQKAGVCYASHFSSMHATCPCIRQPLAFAFGTFLRGTANMTQQNVYPRRDWLCRLSMRLILWGRTREKLKECIYFGILCCIISCDLAWKWLVSGHFVWVKFRI